MKEEIENAMKKSPIVAGFFLLCLGLASAGIVTYLAQAITAGGSVSSPFETKATAVSEGLTLVDEKTVTGNATAGSAQETITADLTNKANQDIRAYLEFACGSADNSLTTDYIATTFGGVAPERICDKSNIAYAYRKTAKETFTAGTTTSETVGFEFPITADGYFTGDYACEINLVASKAC